MNKEFETLKDLDLMMENLIKFEDNRLKEIKTKYNF